MTGKLKKILLPNLPYLLFAWLFDKLCQAVRLSPGADASEKLLHIAQGFTAAFSSLWLSLHPLDLLLGAACAALVRLVVYLKAKNAKKYRKGVEYGSARWGTAADIAPYIDPVPDWNIPLTRTESLTMTSRPKDPKTARNKNILVIGGSGSGKTRFFVKPSLLQMQDEWFSDDLRKLDDKDVYRKMRNHWIIEMAEMLGTSSAKSVEEIKAFISRQKETYKDPYAKYPRDRPRQCVFVGTSNQERFLPLDRTGNRRFYPVQADSEQAEVHILEDPEASREYMRQLWAEIMTIYRNGGWSLRLSPEMEHQMDLRRMDYMAEDTATGTMQAWLDDEFKGDYVCTRQIYNECYKMLGDPDPKAKSEINSIMNNTIDGWERGPTHRFGGVYGTQRSWHRVNRTCKQDEKADQGNGFVKLSDEECRQLKIDEIFGK